MSVSWLERRGRGWVESGAGVWKADLNESKGRRWKGQGVPENKWTGIIWDISTRLGRHNDGERQP